MKIIDLITGKKPSLSFEVFPPKTSGAYDTVREATEAIASLSPSYMSVTCGAGGTTVGFTAEIAVGIQNMGVTPLTHLTCVTATRAKIRENLTLFREKGLENILALRGDLPEGVLPSDLEYPHASQLIEDIVSFGGFCIGGACYPECHPESENSERDIESLRIKAACGCEFFTTQMFFDNNVLYNFLYRLLRAGVHIPVVAGIMPVTHASQIKRIVSLSGTALPQRFVRIVDRYGDKPAAMKQAGIAYATEQIIDLFANGVNAVHIYSMNHPDVAKAIQENLSDIIR